MVYSAKRFVVCITLCHFVLVFFSPFSIAITSLGEEGANLSAFRTFDRFVLVWICQIPLSPDVREGLWFCDCGTPWTFLLPFLTICLWLGPPWFNYWFSFTLSHSRISHEYSSLFIIRGMFEMNCLFLSGDFKFQVSPKVLISCSRSTPRG